MNLLDEVQTTWQIEDKKERRWKLGSFSTTLEIDSSLAKEEVEAIVYFLLDKSFEESDERLQGIMFDLIDQAVIYQDIGPHIDWSNLIKHLPTLKGEALIYSMDFLAASEKKEYILLLEPYIHSPDVTIRDPALQAIHYLQQS